MNFFHFHETQSETNTNGFELKRFKPGGFQEFNDLDLTIQIPDLIIDANLWVQYKWVGDVTHINVFAMDIIKSFIGTFGEAEIHPDLKLLNEKIADLRGTNDKVFYTQGKHPSQVPLPKELQGAIDVIWGKASNWVYTIESTRISMIIQNQKNLNWIHVRVEKNTKK